MSDSQGMTEMHVYDGDPGEPIWESRENYSTYYDYSVDKQCKVPIRSISEVRAELKERYSDFQN